MNLVGGNLMPDSGTMLVDGSPYAPASVRDAERRGIAFIHQELNLFPNLTIAENLFLRAMPRNAAGLVNRSELRRRTTDLLREVDLDLAPETLVERLSPGERQLVEVTKALQLDARIVIFDEPTTSLTPRETALLFNLIARLKAAGKAVIYISHILGDIAAIADDVAVLRDGRLVATGPKADFPAARMINLMLGRDIDQLYPPHEAAVQTETLLETRGLSLPGVVKDISFTLQRGEILGVFGLMGSGRTELARLLFGLDRLKSGEIRIAGEVQPRMTPRRAIGAGMAFITEDRRAEGLMMNMPLADNIALASLNVFGDRFGFIDAERLTVSVREFATALQVKSGNLDRQAARSLSGGNQQKVVVAKWLMAQPTIFLMDEPTRGIDVASKYEIYAIIQSLAVKGSGIVLISSEIEEAMAMADRILVLRGGEMAGAFIRSAFTKDAILRAAFGQEESGP